MQRPHGHAPIAHGPTLPFATTHGASAQGLRKRGLTSQAPATRSLLRRSLRGIGRNLGLVCLIGGLAGCDSIFQRGLGPREGLRPMAPPADLQTTQTPPYAPTLVAHYAEAERDARVRGLLRQGGGGPDSPFTARDLARNFATIAFQDEHLVSLGGGGQVLRRWETPVRIGISFSDAVPAADRRRDTDILRTYAARLARITGHPISFVTEAANFRVYVTDDQGRPAVRREILTLTTGLPPEITELLHDMPLGVHCLVIGFAGADPARYQAAAAVIRAEQPDLLRQACLHEEVAQGLGLRNDSAAARPSIFNDDQEFALLTSQDELLLKMLYDPRLPAGITLQEARPIITRIARDLVGGSS